MKKTSLYIFLLILLVSCGGQRASGQQSVSGTLERGLRVLPVGGGFQSLQYTVYRGDYIVFDLPDTVSIPFTVPDLDIDMVLTRKGNDIPYVKMTKSGTYSFSLGESEGTLNVIDLKAASLTDLSAAEARDLLESRDMTIIDVRTAAEFNSVRIEGAILLPIQELEERLPDLMLDKEDAVLLYCQSGNRSTAASSILLREGYKRVYNLRYGIGDWLSRGYPTK
ncbi:rhodanese-like domain-containing protein [Spirochaeta isovalerica]|uniref:Rhodanese-related sulfurtransferase n=1 Tax=Spirochaeta isovalerica TaxID=150 RepID=A0A841RBP4_9SPIO|nr:rhodanese-like domain-containing protein [Spirochaeta isovalerica]MBB6480657.1 rhodanese-related sulfurtransferase [Spirochaeta isovalerica]